MRILRFSTLSYVLLGLVLMLGTALTALPVDVLAGNAPAFDTDDPLGVEYVGSTGLTNTDPRIVVGRIIQIALGLIGIIMVVLVIWAGFRWMTSGGKSDEIEDAKKTLTAAVIGLAIVLMAYSLTYFILGELYNATSGRTLY